MRWKPGYRPGGKTDWPVVDRPVVQWRASPDQEPLLYCRFFVRAPQA